MHKYIIIIVLQTQAYVNLCWDMLHDLKIAQIWSLPTYMNYEDVGFLIFGL